MCKTLFSVTLASAMLMVTGGHHRVEAIGHSNDSNVLISSVEFESPNDIPPTNTAGGGVRGEIQFEPAGDSAPATSASGGVRGTVNFASPGEAAPSRVVGGGVRGNVNFASPGEAAPSRVVGGGVRGTVNFASPGEAAPSRVVGGAVRGNVDFQPAGDPTVRDTAGSGVRGDAQFEAPGDPTVDRSVSGGVRGDELSKIVPLMPKTNYGRTISGRPTFLIYVPPTASKEVFFSLQDANRNHHYQSKFQISGQGGIVELTLPDEAPELEMGKEYVWFLAPIASDGILRPDNYGVNGWVKRVDSPIESHELSSLSPVKLATLYAREGIWYDTLQVLSAAKLAQPDDPTLANEWKDLLEQVGLEAIVNQPISEQL